MYDFDWKNGIILIKSLIMTLLQAIENIIITWLVGDGNGEGDEEEDWSALIA